MKPNYSISIPKPCHEDWSKMAPKEKGQFCQSCSKTVVDFTKMDTDKIQEYIHNNRNQRICGHLKQNQLDTINLKIPETVFNQNLSFNRLFLFALLFSMGITLFNCEDEKGKTKKIESVEIIETHHKPIGTIINHDNTKKTQLDTTSQQKLRASKIEATEKQVVDGMMIIETVGDIEVTPIDVNEIDPINIDSLEIEESTYCPRPDDIVIGFIHIENPPEFIDTPSQLSSEEKKDFFSERINQIVSENFDISQGDIGLSGKQRIFTQFTINKNGKVDNIKTRAPHPAFEIEAKRVLNLLPEFKPARQRGENVSMTYTLPITFILQD